MRITCTRWRSLERNTMLGFADLEVGDLGLLIKECTVHCKGDRGWVGMPGKPQIDKNGAAIRDQATGKVQYTNVLQFVARSFSDEFNAAAFAAIERAFPGALTAASPDARTSGARTSGAAGTFHNDEIPFAPERR